MRAGIALGSNLGERTQLLKEAIGHLRLLHERGDFLLSAIHETAPQDCPADSPSFLNAVVELETSLTPLELFAHLQGMETAAGRPASHGRNEPRTLDLDLLYCDQMTLRHPDLELPHPRILEREFVLLPLSEIRPDLQLPGWSQSCENSLFDLRKNTTLVPSQ